MSSPIFFDINCFIFILVSALLIASICLKNSDTASLSSPSLSVSSFFSGGVVEGVSE